MKNCMYFNFKLTLSIGSTISEGGGVGGGYQRAPCEREKNIVCICKAIIDNCFHKVLKCLNQCFAQLWF